MFRALSTDECACASPTAFLLGLLDLDSMWFKTTLATLMAIYSQRPGSGGASVMALKRIKEKA